MKILVVTSGYPDVNSIKKLFAHEQNIAFMEKGCLVEVVNMNANIENINGEIYDKVRVYKLLSAKNNLLKIFTNLKNLKNNFSGKYYDLVIFNGLATNQTLYLKFFKSISSKQAVIVHGTDGVPDKNILKNILRRHILKNMDWIFPVSNYTDTILSCLEKRTNESAKKTRVVYNGCDTSKFLNVLKVDKNILRKKFKIEEDTFVILTVCDLIPRKGIDILLKAIAVYAKDNQNYLHVIIGRGEEKENLVNYAKELDIYNHIRFIDYLEDSADVAKYYGVSDVYCMVSKNVYNPPGVEGFGISYIEASYIGVPVIGGSNGGTTTAVKHNFTGYLVDPYSESCYLDIANYLTLLDNDKNEYKRLSENGKKMVLEEFTWKHNVEKILEIVK